MGALGRGATRSVRQTPARGRRRAVYAHIFGPRRVDERRAPPSRSQRGQHGDRGGGGESHSRGAGGVHRKMLCVFRVFLGVRVLAEQNKTQPAQPAQYLGLCSSERTPQAASRQAETRSRQEVGESTTRSPGNNTQHAQPPDGDHSTWKHMATHHATPALRRLRAPLTPSC